MTKFRTFEPLPFAPTQSEKKHRVAQLGVRQTLCIVFAFCIATAISASAQTFTTLASFDFANGAYPAWTLIQDTNGNFYGTTSAGADASCHSEGCGTLFEITPAGTLKMRHQFIRSDGVSPQELLLATNGNFYGITVRGGAYKACSPVPEYCGTLFESSPSGKLNVLVNFTSNGSPTGLIQDADGNFYGTGEGGGDDVTGYSTIFRVTASGTLTTFYTFDYGEGFPTGLVQDTDGNFYGTIDGYGYPESYVFKVSPAGKQTYLYTFNNIEMAGPLIQAADGNFYGVTQRGGNGAACEDNFGCGTVFEISPRGAQTTLYSFCSLAGCTDGEYPTLAALVQGTDGNFYGTTQSEGAYGYGTVFEITSAGTLTTLHSFDATDGSSPNGLMQGTDGNFYGTTYYGGSSENCTDGCGTVFSLDVGLDPFVAFVRNSGKVGWTAEILGQGFTGTTGVSFNGTAAAFTIKNDTYLEATVPAGATTGPVTVATPGGTLTSNTRFRVTP
jgi:uncharacterized repeat protein (TIGR03803 family)